MSTLQGLNIEGAISQGCVALLLMVLSLGHRLGSSFQDSFTKRIATWGEEPATNPRLFSGVASRLVELGTQNLRYLEKSLCFQCVVTDRNVCPTWGRLLELGCGDGEGFKVMPLARAGEGTRAPRFASLLRLGFLRFKRVIDRNVCPTVGGGY